MLIRRLRRTAFWCSIQFRMHRRALAFRHEIKIALEVENFKVQSINGSTHPTFPKRRWHKSDFQSSENPTFQGDKTQYTMAQGKCLVLSISCRLSRYKLTASDKPWRLHATFDRAPTLQFSISFYKENQKVITVNVFDTKTATVAKRFVKLYILNLTFRKMCWRKISNSYLSSTSSAIILS